MHCSSCNGEVPSSMNHAFALNQCPYCGDSIFDKSAGALILALKKQIFVEDETLNDQIVSTVLDVILDKFDIVPKQVLVEESAGQTVKESAGQTVRQSSIRRSEISRVDDDTKTIPGIMNMEDLADLSEEDLKLLNTGAPENQRVTMEDVAKAKETRNKKLQGEIVEEQSSKVLTKLQQERKPVSRRG